MGSNDPKKLPNRPPADIDWTVHHEMGLAPVGGAMAMKGNDMNRKFKALGLALFAVLAMSAVAASSASAGFKAGADHVVLTTSASAMQKFAPTAGGTDVECTTLKTDKGTINSATTKTTTVTVEPTYSNCETFLGAATSVATNGCHYLFHSPENSTTGTTDVVCPEGKTIVISVGSICRYTIGSQNNLGVVHFTNVGSGQTEEVEVEPTVAGITSTRTTNDFFCPAGGSTGTYTGNSTITGEDVNGNHVPVTVD
jgi:hypothetical protein